MRSDGTRLSQTSLADTKPLEETPSICGRYRRWSSVSRFCTRTLEAADLWPSTGPLLHGRLTAARTGVHAAELEKPSTCLSKDKVFFVRCRGTQQIQTHAPPSTP